MNSAGEILHSELVECDGYTIKGSSSWRNIFNGFSSFSRLRTGKSNYPVSFVAFRKRMEARKVFKLWMRNQNIEGCVRVLDCLKMGKVFVIVIERVYSTFEAWLGNLNEKHIWKFNATGSLIQMGEKLQIVFKRVMKIVDNLHEAKRCHGNLGLGISIKSNLSVKLFNFQPPTRLTDGVKNDINAMEDLVKRVVKIRSDVPNQENPKSLSTLRESFHLLCNQLPTNMSELRKYSYFLFNHPLFMNANERYIFIMKANWLRKKNKALFDKSVFESPFTSLGRWHQNIPTPAPPKPNHPLRDLLTYQHNTLRKYIPTYNKSKKHFKNRFRSVRKRINIPRVTKKLPIFSKGKAAPPPSTKQQYSAPPVPPKLNYGYRRRGGAVLFFRNSFQHYDDKNFTTSLLQADEELQKYLPMVIPKVYFGMVKNLNVAKIEAFGFTGDLMDYFCKEIPTTHGLP